MVWLVIRFLAESFSFKVYSEFTVLKRQNSGLIKRTITSIYIKVRKCWFGFCFCAWHHGEQWNGLDILFNFIISIPSGAVLTLFHSRWVFEKLDVVINQTTCYTHSHVLMDAVIPFKSSRFPFTTQSFWLWQYTLGSSWKIKRYEECFLLLTPTIMFI